METNIAMAVPMDQDLVRIFADFSKCQQTQWDLETKRKRIASKAATIVHCDGELSSQTRNFLCDIDLLLPQFVHDPDAILTIVKKIATGALNLEIQRFLSEAPTQVNWAVLKSHIENTF